MIHLSAITSCELWSGPSRMTQHSLVRGMSEEPNLMRASQPSSNRTFAISKRTSEGKQKSDFGA